MLYSCKTCTYSFYSEWAHVNDMDDEGHWLVCETFDRSFLTWRDCERHINRLNHRPRCQTCDGIFWTWGSCEQHMDEPGHWRNYPCEMCNRSFGSQKAATQHMNTFGHWTPNVPRDTDETKFHTQALAKQYARVIRSYENYCRSCARFFDNKNNVRMDLNSRIHRDSNVTCPYCQTGYTTASGLSHHLETGCCSGAPKMNRETIYRTVSELDTKRLLTHPNGWQDDANAQYIVTPKAWNGFGWECYLCISSKIYHCPNKKCLKPFATLADLFNHLKSERSLVKSFEQV
ncbi:hypothetical protein BJY01DRAFT_240910 [Aspergillus pseudoustus]|uniref:C2H2-type domain-containing protein n=1 Tax=Aspergillus pseudoustus TaxID=1810923 RepID=A0ABR4IKX6_9EURO